MKETELIGKLLPGHPDIFPIIESIREKYFIPPVDPEDDIGAILLTRDDIDWDAVKKDIDTQVQNLPLFEGQADTYIQNLRIIVTTTWDFPELDSSPDKVKAAFMKLVTIMIKTLTPMLTLIDAKTYTPIKEMVYEYLLTGKTREVPQDWLGVVMTINVLGEKSVMAIAGEAADPKVIAEQFKSEFTKTFGKRNFSITETHLSTAEYLRMKLEGNSLKRLVERYQELHPSEFPPNKTSKEYRQTVNRHKEMMKKRMDRLWDVIEKMAGDNY